MSIALGLAAWVAACGPGAPERAGPASAGDGGADGKVSRSARGAVVSQSALATAVGVRVLEEGGNAVDAAVATAFALTVVEPTNSGLGGRTQVLIRTPEGGLAAIDGTTEVPRGYPTDPASIPPDEYGYRTVGIPGTVAALVKALREHGTWPLERVLAPVIELAEKGFALPAGQANALARVAERLREFEGSRRYFLRPDGSPYQAGETFVQAELARTLRAIAAGGAEAFYRGEIAARIAEDMAANGGYVTREDLAAYRPRDAVILRGSYRGHDLIATYLPAAGATTIGVLHILENFDLAAMTGAAPWAVIVAQALAIGFRERMADLAEGRKAAERLTSKEWAAARAREIRLAEEVAPVAVETGPREGSFPDGHTTHLSVVDARGGAVALTQSLGPTLGSKVVSPELGFAYAATMGYLGGSAASADVAQLRPGDRASSRQSPLIVLRDGRVAYVLGASGARRIISAIVQVLSRSIDQGLPFAEAMAAPRVHVEPSEPGVVHMEAGEDRAWSPEDRAFVRGFGFDVRDRHTESVANVSAIWYDAAAGEYVAVADPRGEGRAGAAR